MVQLAPRDHPTWQCLVCFCAMALFYIPLMAMLPSLSQYIVRRRCEVINGSQVHCDSPKVSSSASLWSNWIWMTCNGPSFLTALALGSLSDVFGRRKVLLFNVITQCVGSFGMMFVVLTHVDIWWFAPFFFVNGVGGGGWVFVTLVMASLADSATTEAQREWLFGIAMGVYYASGALGPLIGGQFTSSSFGELLKPHAWCQQGTLSVCEGGTLQFNFILFFITNILLAILIITCFRETVAQEALRAARAATKGKGFLYWAVEPTLRPCRTVLAHKVLTVLVALYAFCYIGFSDRNGLLIIYAQKEPFNMNPSELGWFLFYPWLVRTFAVFFVLPTILRLAFRFFSGTAGADHDSATFASHIFGVRFGCAFAICLTAFFGLAKTQLQLSLLTAAEGFDAIWDASARVVFTDVAKALGLGQGEVLGVIGFLQTLLAVIAPNLFQSVYAGTVDWYPGFAFLLISALTAVGVCLTWCMPAPDHWQSGSNRVPVAINESDPTEKTPLVEA